MLEDRTTVIKAVIVMISLMVLGGSGFLSIMSGIGLLVMGGLGGAAAGVIVPVLKMVGIGLGLISVPVVLWYAMFRM